MVRIYTIVTHRLLQINGTRAWQQQVTNIKMSRGNNNRKAEEQIPSAQQFLRTPDDGQLRRNM
jgi:hypothetical protein